MADEHASSRFRLPWTAARAAGRAARAGAGAVRVARRRCARGCWCARSCSRLDGRDRSPPALPAGRRTTTSCMAKAEQQQLNDGRDAGRARRHPRPQRPRAGLQRRRRDDRRRPVRGRGPGRDRARCVCGALEPTATPQHAQAIVKAPAAQGPVRLSRAQGLTGRGGARPRARPQGRRLYKESRRYYPNASCWRHVLGYVGTRQRRPRRARGGLRRADPRHARAGSCCRRDAPAEGDR